MNVPAGGSSDWLLLSVSELSKVSVCLHSVMVALQVFRCERQGQGAAAGITGGGLTAASAYAPKEYNKVRDPG